MFAVRNVFSAAALAAVVSAAFVAHADAAASAGVRWTFDGNIRNNSLAVSPNEGTAVVSYSERPDVIVYNLQTGKVRGVLHGYVTPRNIVFAPSGKFFMSLIAAWAS